uniref:Trace amine associated receptor 8 n=1 Tax=Cebus imitator TaxID=2715852 RepID=A0A2K5Q9T4_CEBIM
MTGNFPQPVVQLCYEDVNGFCIKTPYSPGSGLILFGSLLAVFGNLIVMTSVLHFKQLHSLTNFLIASLACADFFVGVTVMPFCMVRSVESCWYFGAKFCTFHSCCDVAFCYSSVLHLCFICIDRYIAVTDPLAYPTKFTVSGICISVSWILPLMYSGAVFYTGASDDGLEEFVSALSCVGGCQIVVNQGWVLIDFLLFFIPTLVMIILYSKIFLIAKQQICCWGAYYNSAINPLIYALFYPWFRKAIKLILSGDVLKDSPSTISLFSE